MITTPKIELVKQRYDFDCGQACLEMLGYEGHRLFPDSYLSEDQLKELAPSTKIVEESKHYQHPVMLQCRSAQDIELWHWAVAHQDKAFCPSLGTMPLSDYVKYYVWVNQVFEVPVQSRRFSLPGINV